MNKRQRKKKEKLHPSWIKHCHICNTQKIMKDDGTFEECWYCTTYNNMTEYLQEYEHEYSRKS